MRYIIGFLITVGLLILLVVLLLTGGNKKSQTPQSNSDRPRTTSELAAYADTDVVARMIIDGPINANQNHRAIRVTVGQNEVTYEQIQGYEGKVVNTRTYNNNQSAYSNFLYALGRNGFTLMNNDPKLPTEKGHCALGNRYIFEFVEGDHDIMRSWTTSCGGSIRTYEGNVGVTMQLFKLQVPDYQSLANSQ